jgi:uncharacterized protein (DUF302 family)
LKKLEKVAQAVMPPEKMIEMFTYKSMSSKSVDEIAQKIPRACENYKFALLQKYNYHEIVKEKGFPIQRKVYIYEICQAKTASLMLTDHPEFSNFMPCKLALYEDNDEAVLSTMNMEIVLKAVRDNEQLFNDASSLYNALKTMMQSLTGNN